MAHWDLASMVVAIIAVLVALNPQIMRLFFSLHRRTLIWFKPDRGFCHVLLWDDIHNDMHKHDWLPGQETCEICAFATSHRTSCSRFPQPKHVKANSCWEKTASLVFNNVLVRRAPRKKPELFPLEASFLRTEARLVLAYLIITVQCYNFDIAQFLELEQRGDLIICHLKSPQRVLGLTRAEVERMLEGWPPFYRETSRTEEGHILHSPITRLEQVRRPGWIAAVGLGGIEPSDVCLSMVSFDLAIARFRLVLDVAFSNSWPGYDAVQSAIRECVGIVQREDLSYGPPRVHLSLTYEECNVTMQVFSTMKIDMDQKRILEPVLSEVLERVLDGLQRVVTYQDMHKGGLLKIPEFLQGDRIVYLRGCYADCES